VPILKKRHYESCSSLSHYERVPNYRDLTPQDEWDLLERGLNRVTDTCIPEHEAFRRLQNTFTKFGRCR
jgi:deoxyhypusine synthase